MAADMPPASLADGLAHGLERLLGQHVQARPGTIRLGRVSAGAVQETWVIDCDTPTGPAKFVLRRAPQTQTATHGFNIGLDREVEIITLARAHGVPAPEVIFRLRPEDDLGTGFVMRHVAGETIARKILRDDRFAAVRPHLARNCGEVLARLHDVPVDRAPPLKTQYAGTRLGLLWDNYMTHDRRRPVFDLAFRWLRDRLPSDPPTPCMVHGDFRNGNLMIDETGIAAVLDWELTHFGDPAEDLGWLCVPSWRFGEIDKEAGGFGPITDLLAGYEAASGRAVDRARLQFWIVFGTLFWGISCVDFAEQFRRGDRTVERAAIGRRASETEIDLLTLIAPQNGGRT